MNETRLVKEYNELRDKALNAPEVNGKEYLQSLTDHNLKVFVTGKTMQYGRNFKASWANANSHLKNRERCIDLFSRRIDDRL